MSFNQYVIENLDFETGSISAKRDVPMTLKLDAHRGVAGESVALTAKLTLQDNPDDGVLQVAALNVDGTLTRPGDSQPIRATFAGCCASAESGSVSEKRLRRTSAKTDFRSIRCMSVVDHRVRPSKPTCNKTTKYVACCVGAFFFSLPISNNSQQSS